MSRINHPIKAALALSLSVAAIAPAAASASPYIDSSASGPLPTATPVQVVHLSSHDGFNWGDAGIGAAGGIGIAMLASGGGLLVVRTRRDHLDPATR